MSSRCTACPGSTSTVMTVAGIGAASDGAGGPRRGAGRSGTRSSSNTQPSAKAQYRSPSTARWTMTRRPSMVMWNVVRSMRDTSTGVAIPSTESGPAGGTTTVWVAPPALVRSRRTSRVISGPGIGGWRSGQSCRRSEVRDRPDLVGCGGGDRRHPRETRALRYKCLPLVV